MGQAQINVRTRACSRTSIARTKQAALTHNVRGKELTSASIVSVFYRRGFSAHVSSMLSFFSIGRKRTVWLTQVSKELIYRGPRCL